MFSLISFIVLFLVFLILQIRKTMMIKMTTNCNSKLSHALVLKVK